MHEAKSKILETALLAEYRTGEPDALSVEDTARCVSLGRSLLYKAISPDPAVRGGLPFLPSLLVGRRRVIRTEARRLWLAQLEMVTAGRAEGAIGTGAEQNQERAPQTAPALR